MSHWTENELETWIKALKEGEVTAAPAEGVYGYCADPFNQSALRKLVDLKQRDDGKGLILLIGHTHQLVQLCDVLDGDILMKLYDLWGQVDAKPTTVLLPAKNTLWPLLTGGRDTIAVRLPDCDYMKEYLEAWGQPLVSTSLNISGEDPATSAAAIPDGIPALRLENDLPGGVSRIYDIKKDEYIR